MPQTRTKAEKTRLKHLEQKKARQLTYAKKHQGGRYSKRLRRVEDLRVKNMTKSAKGNAERPGVSVKAKAALNRSSGSCL